MSNIINNIENLFPKLTKSERKIAAFITNNIHEVPYLSITSLAESCHVAEATITRFCRKMKLNGYNELKLCLAKDEYISENNFQDDDNIKSDENSEILIREIMSLKETYNLINIDNYQRAVHYINSAQNVYCIGQGGSSATAYDAWSRFITVSSQFRYIEDNHFQIMTAALCNINDVILYFSYSGATRDIIDILKYAKSKQTKIILVTRHENCPAAEYADVILLCGARETPLESGSIAAKISQLYIIDILFHKYCQLNQDNSRRNLESTTRALTSKLL